MLIKWRVFGLRLAQNQVKVFSLGDKIDTVKSMRIFDRQFSTHRLNYILQSAMAAVAVWLALMALHRHNLLVVASLAATSFTVFAVPNSVMASARNVIGGHFIGLVVGSLCAMIAVDSSVGQDLIYALAVGLAMFLMVLTNTEHPPAAGTALGVVIYGFSSRVILGVVVGVGILTVVHWLLRPVLRDLIVDAENKRGG